MKNWPNPFIKERADPFILLHEQRYYFMGSVPDYDCLELRSASTLLGLRKATPIVVWRKPDSGPCSELIWAPEMHRVGDRWVIYFSAAPSREMVNDLFQHRMFALICDGDNPLTDPWRECHQIATPLDTFSLDGTYCFHQGRHFYLWAQQIPDIEGNTCLLMAELSEPWTLKGEPLLLSRPELAWEKGGGTGVNEAPTTLFHDDRFFVAYSAAVTDEHYAMGLLWADKDADPLKAENWMKVDHAVLSTNVENQQFGPGHSCFTADGQGRDVLIYHTRNHAGMAGDAKYDPSRHTRLKYFSWREDGMPDFGQPKAENH
ncbi:alpha-N-arabinofuranosidase [Candidatus Pantoea deserta]|uniref:Alpha-N-arabinofuranosidase n=1 Tax=Candidatus Pantoea deserta TaxID=1869313 RepID=A0A3N4NDP6_9GAMM|nr:family 43 glycosylhydrolase [Pantoea deserta]RPD94522.1 alpha-N-arabinofuranosidase [Pantoea deserta]